MDRALIMFKRKLSQKQSRILQLISEISVHFYSEDLNLKNTLLTALMTECKELNDLGGPDTPEWVDMIYNLSNNVIRSPNDVIPKVNMMKTINNLIKSIELHDWEKGGYDNSVYFENIYKKYKDESKLPELFNEIIQIIEKILEDEDIELHEAEEKIRFLLTVVKSNSETTLYGDESVLRYLMFFLKEFALNMAKTIPGLNEAILALLATAKKIHEEFSTVRGNTESEIKKKTTMGKLELYDIDGQFKELEDNLSKKIDLLT